MAWGNSPIFVDQRTTKIELTVTYPLYKKALLQKSSLTQHTHLKSLKVQASKEPKTNRLQVVDALRGFALFGILIVHCSQCFSAQKLPENLYQIYIDGSLNGLMNDKIALLFENKFYTLFSFLFGLSFSIILSRSPESPTVFKRIFLRRMLILGAIGFLHYLHWRGDILLIYAILGWLLLLFNKVSDKTILLTAALFVLSVPGRLIYLSTYWDAKPELMKIKHQSKINLSAQKEVTNFQVLQYGSYKDTIVDNLNSTSDFISIQFDRGRIYKIFGFFLLGLYAGRRRVFQHLEDNRLLWWKYTICCIVAFLSSKVMILSLDQIYGQRQQGLALIESLYQLVYDLSSTSLTLFYIGGMTLFFQYWLGRWAVPLLGTVGKMSLTNYLLQTLIGSLLFFNYGLGLFGVVELWQAVLLSLPIYLFQLVFSIYWLRHFRYGPVEWVWRSLTYGKAQPMRV